MKKSFRIALGILLTAVFLVGLGTLARQGFLAAKNNISNQTAQELVDLPDTPPPLQEAPPSSTEPSPPPGTEPAITPEPGFYDPYAASLLDLDLSALQAVNSDVIGWISIPDTPISYPLLQGTDNNYYLNHAWDRVYNPGGSIFLEYKNRPDLNNFNTIIFGHRMSDSSMFNSLRHYSGQEYLESHPRVYIATTEGVRVYRIFAAMTVTVTDPVYWLITTQEKYKQPMIDFCLEHSVLKTDLIPSAEARFLTLSTCTGLTVTDDRWVVVAVEEGILSRSTKFHDQLQSTELTGAL